MTYILHPQLRKVQYRLILALGIAGLFLLIFVLFLFFFLERRLVFFSLVFLVFLVLGTFI